MAYESIYEAVSKPHVPDATRGHWAAPSDFVYACLGLAFKLDIFLVSWYFFFRMNISIMILYMICLALFVVPLIVVQSYLGQFSSSGFISVFRLSPLFKGMGFISLLINFAVLVAYSLFAAMPLQFLFNSFLGTLPWSCEGLANLQYTLPTRSRTLCDIQHKFTINGTNDTSDPFINYQIPSAIFFKSSFAQTDVGELSISWELVGCTLLLWVVIAGVFYKFFNTAKFGLILRYSIWTTLTLLLICLVRFFFLPGAATGVLEYLTPQLDDFGFAYSSIPLYTIAALGPGWGSIISLASFNHFKTNVMRYSWIIGIGQMLIFLAFGLILCIVDNYYLDLLHGPDTVFVEHHVHLFLSIGHVIANFELANMWSILFFGMLTLAALVVMLTQLYSVLISVYDEFELLRSRRTEVTFSLIGVLALCSLYFCTNHGLLLSSALSIDSQFTQTGLNLLLLLVVLWIYGRERFQRDFEFMVSQHFATWKVNSMRFLAPLFLLLALLLTLGSSVHAHLWATLPVHIFAVLLIALPWLFIPGFAIFILLQTSGPLGKRLKCCCRPTDWYPVELDDRQRYHEATSSLDIRQQYHDQEVY